MFFLITQSAQVTDLFLRTTRGSEIVITTIDDVIEDIVYGQYLPAHCITCIETTGDTKLSPIFLKKLAQLSRIIVYSSKYNADLFIYYWAQGIVYIADQVTPTELAKLFAIPISENIKEKQHHINMTPPMVL